MGRRDVEHVADAGRAGAVGELAGDRGLRGVGVDRHEGAAPAEQVEVGGEVLGGHALEAHHGRIEDRVDGVDAVDGALRAVFGVVASSEATFRSFSTSMYTAGLSVATAAPAQIRSRRAAIARLRETTPRPEASKNVAFMREAMDKANRRAAEIESLSQQVCSLESELYYRWW